MQFNLCFQIHFIKGPYFISSSKKIHFAEREDEKYCAYDTSAIELSSFSKLMQVEILEMASSFDISFIKSNGS